MITEFVLANVGLTLLVLAVLVFVHFLAKSVYLVKQAEAIVIERFGRYSRVLHPGVHFITPFFEQPRSVYWTFVQVDENHDYIRVSKELDRIDLRESMYDFPRQNVITKDNVTMEINALLYYQITDPKAAVYEVLNLPEAIEKLTQTTLRNVIGSMDLDQSLVSRDEINTRLRLLLDEATDKWGVKINRVELQEVNPPLDIRHAMEKQMRAERDRRAIILESEGKKRSAILEAEGERESKVLRAQGESESRIVAAEGEAQARLRIAKAEAEAIELIRKAIPQENDATSYMIAQEYVRALPKMMEGKNDKLVVVPYESGSFIGSVASIKKIFDATK